jgi:hypothetical protein
MHNLNFASNENFAEARKALPLLLQKNQGQSGQAQNNCKRLWLKNLRLKQISIFYFSGPKRPLFFFKKFEFSKK